jgi:hypothetical protein
VAQQSRDLPPEPPMIGPLAKSAPETPSNGNAPPTDGSAGAGSTQAATSPAEPPKVSEVPIEKCASIAASIARRRDETPAILKENEITAADYQIVEKYWNDAIRKETDRGRMTLLKAYDTAYVAQLEKERGPITIDEYARLVIASERGQAAPTLTELKLPRGSYLRIERVWLDKVTDDPELAASVRKAILAARLD